MNDTNGQGAATTGSTRRTASQPSQPASGSTNLASGVATLTMTETEAQNENDEVLHLTLRARPSVTWDENVVDNEGLGRKSSKRCCIFHKQRAFGESSTDSSDVDSDGSSSSGGPSNGGQGLKIARKKKSSLQQKKVPNYQRFHA